MANSTAQNRTTEDRLRAVEDREGEGHEQALPHVRELVRDDEMPEDLEVLHRQRVAAVVVRHRLRPRAECLALGDALDDR